ncbi:MAG TPA: zinc ribbon domain-containing protein [Bellilinea sp.]|nr:zinc ribbon domain-containing protein [Bellilinea sp.]
MPVYEYRCLDCKTRFSVRVSYADYDTFVPVCSHCGSGNTQRKIGRVRVARSDESRMDQYADADLAGLEDDPQAMGRMMRKMSGELGEAMPDQFNEMVDRLESGQSPEEIEAAMPLDDAGED